jgi:hypothetical protein
VVKQLPAAIALTPVYSGVVAPVSMAALIETATSIVSPAAIGHLAASLVAQPISHVISSAASTAPLPYGLLPIDSGGNSLTAPGSAPGSSGAGSSAPGAAGAVAALAALLAALILVTWRELRQRTLLIPAGIVQSIPTPPG